MKTILGMAAILLASAMPAFAQVGTCFWSRDDLVAHMETKNERLVMYLTAVYDSDTNVSTNYMIYEMPHGIPISDTALTWTLVQNTYGIDTELYCVIAEGQYAFDLDLAYILNPD